MQRIGHVWAMSVFLGLILATNLGLAQYGYGLPIDDVDFETYATRDTPLWEPFARYADHPIYGQVGRAVGMLVADLELANGRIRRQARLCTATLIAHDRIITNAHCLFDPSFSVTNAWIRMDYHDEGSATTDLALNPRPLDSNFKLDFAVLQVLDEHTYSPVPLAFDSAATGDSLFMIHHSASEPKRISRHGCTLINRSHAGQTVQAPPLGHARPLDPATDRFHFCDSLGSSGSLLFADRGGEATIVGLHFAGAMTDVRRNILPEDRRFNLFIDIRSIVEFSATLRPGRAPGSVSIASTPSSARVLINDIEYGVTPTTVEGLDAGVYEVRLSLEGHAPEEFSVLISAGERASVTRVLRPAPVRGSLTIASTPSAARIVINGAEFGTTPRTFHGLEPGDYLVRLDQDGYAPEEFLVTIAPGESAAVSRALVPLAGAGAGAVGDVHELFRRAADGGVVSLGPGVYRIEQNLDLQGNVEIIGSGRDVTRILITERADAPAFRGAGTLSVRGVTLERVGGHGNVLSVHGDVLIDVRDSRFIGGSRGEGGAATGAALLVGDQVRGTVRSSEFLRSLDGLYVAGPAELTIEGNLFRDNEWSGLRLVGSHSQVADNTSTQNAYGISVEHDSRPQVRSNMLHDNHEAGISFWFTSAGVAEANEIWGNRTGITIRHDAAPVLRRNTVRDNRESGIYVAERASGTIVANHVQGNQGHGIVCFGDASALITLNELHDNNGYGWARSLSSTCTSRQDNPTTGNGLGLSGVVEQP